ncbi:bacteriohemerythrin [Patescibacteria group bacterium]
MPIPWSQDLSVNIKEIDEQHKHFLGLLNKTYDVFYKLKKEEVPQLVKELHDYTQTHFETEEKYFDKFNYEFTNDHKKEHRELEAKVEEFNRKIKSEGVEAIGELVEFLEDWLVEHMANHDKKYTKCFNEHGLF